MRVSLTTFAATLVVVILLLAMFAAAASVGFFGNAFEGFFGPNIETSGSTGTSSTLRPLPTATVRR